MNRKPMAAISPDSHLAIVEHDSGGGAMASPAGPSRETRQAGAPLSALRRDGAEHGSHE